MKKTLMISLIILIIVFLVPSLAKADTVSFKVGYFIPRAESDLWQIEFENMDFKKSDFMGSNFGFSYEYFLTRELSLALSIDGYTRKKVGLYNDYIKETVGGQDYAFDYGEGYGISHVFDVSITPIQVSLKIAPLGRKGSFIPYVGGGVGIYLWNVRIQGDMIDFSDPVEFYDTSLDEYVIGYPVYITDAREENKIKLGYHALGGVMFPIANRISIEGEFKYNFLKGNFSESFLGFEAFDLSGYQISIGLNYWF